MKTKAQLLKIAFRLVLIGLANLIILTLIAIVFIMLQNDTDKIIWFEIWTYSSLVLFGVGIVMLVIINLGPIKENLRTAKDHITFFWNYDG